MILLINHPSNLVAILANNTQNALLFGFVLGLPCVQKGFGRIQIGSSGSRAVFLPNVEHQKFRTRGLRLCHVKLHLRA